MQGNTLTFLRQVLTVSKQLDSFIAQVNDLHRMDIAGSDIQIVSKHALAFYHERHNHIEQAHQGLLAARAAPSKGRDM